MSSSLLARTAGHLLASSSCGTSPLDPLMTLQADEGLSLSALRAMAEARMQQAGFTASRIKAEIRRLERDPAHVVDVGGGTFIAFARG